MAPGIPSARRGLPGETCNCFPRRPGGRLRVGGSEFVPASCKAVAGNGEGRRAHEDDALGSLPLGPAWPISRPMASQEIEAWRARWRGFRLGPRSRGARCCAVKRRENALGAVARCPDDGARLAGRMPTCGNANPGPVRRLRHPRRDARQLCVVEDVADLWALDRARLFPGRYTCSGAALALEGVRPEDLSIGKLIERSRPAASTRSCSR